MEFTKENFDKILTDFEKLKENDANKEKALQEERAKRKELREKVSKLESATNEELEAFRKEKALLEEKEAKKKGKYEELLAAKDKELEELKTKLPTLEEQANKYTEFLNKQLDTKLEAIPEDKREFVSKAIDGKGYELKIELLDGFNKEYNPDNKDFKNKPAGDKGVDKSTTEYQKAKESGSVVDMIANAPVVE